MSKYFEPTFESLRERTCPEWFRDAKFGIWSHWGASSVAMKGDWYGRSIYIPGTEEYIYHWRTYGHPSKFGYKDLVKLWKAENFNPEELMELYHQAGARYFMGQAMHHDHFFNYPSQYNRFNSAEMGPKKDICGLWKRAADTFHMPFGLSEHLGATYAWSDANKYCDLEGAYAGVPYDGNDPEYRDFYIDNYEVIGEKRPTQWEFTSQWYTKNEKFREYWLNVMKEVIQKYEPDLLYSDGGLPFGEPDALPDGGDYRVGLEAVADLYNTSIDKYGENRAVYLQKDRRPEIYKVGILDVERSQLPELNTDPWHTDTCIGGWFYNKTQKYKKPGHVIEMLVDIISKNGNLLLNIPQRPDGTIDEESKYILKEIGGWFAVCGEAVYGTRPWRIYGEGATSVVIDGFTEDETKWTSSDYRFVKKENTLYAYMMRTPENGVAVIKSLTPEEKVCRVRLLGEGDVEFSQNYGVLTVKLPKKMSVKYVNCLALTLEKR